MPRLHDLLPLLAALACSSEDPEERRDDPGESVALGVPGGDDGLEFVPLETGDVLRLQTFGQGGTHVMLAARCIGFGSRAYVAFGLENLNTHVEITAPAPVRPQLLYCDDAGVCDLVPVTVMTAGLTEPDEERHGLPVRVTVEAWSDAGAHAEDSREAALSTEDL